MTHMNLLEKFNNRIDQLMDTYKKDSYDSAANATLHALADAKRILTDIVIHEEITYDEDDLK